MSNLLRPSPRTHFVARGIASVIALAAVAFAQAPDFTLDAVLERGGAFLPTLPQLAWITDDAAFSLVRPKGSGDARAEAVLRLTVDGAQPEELFDSVGLHAAFELESLSPTKLPAFSWLDPRTIRVEHEHAVWHWNYYKAEPIRVLELPAIATATAIAPNDARVACVIADDLMVIEGFDRSATEPSKAPHRERLTWDGKDGDIVYGGAAHRAEFGIRDGLWWDHGGRRLAFSREDMRQSAEYPYVDWTSQPARRKHGRYPMAGQPHSKVTIGIYDTADRSLRYLEHDPAADLYWTNVTFSPAGDKVYVALVNRGQNHLELVEFDTASGARLRTLFHESNPRWIEPEAGPMFLPPVRDAAADDAAEDATATATDAAATAPDFLWFSRRDGFQNLYHYRADGSLVRQLTKATFDLSTFGGFTDDGSCCYVTGTGDNPLEMHLWRVQLADGVMHKLTPGRGRHDVLVSDHDDLLVRSQSAVDPGRWTLHLRGVDAEPRVIASAADPLAGRDVGTGEFFTVEADDGTTLHGYLLKPPGFDPAQRYPLLHYVYGGPKSQLVTDSWGFGANLWLRYMASQGFLVSCVDNRGTDHRGIEFSQAVFRRLGTIEVDDQLAAIRHLIARGSVDTDRIGVHGWSYGGYMTLRLLLGAPEMFAAGVAGAPVTDWHAYETGYTERYMDTPQENPDGYSAASVLPLVPRLRARLLLVTPSDDQTVMTSHSIAFLQQCIEHGVLVDHMTYPMQQHGLRGLHRNHFYRLMTRYFRDHLLRENLVPASRVPETPNGAVPQRRAQ